MSTFIRKTKTASGATAVQIVTKEGSDIVAIDHIGSAQNQQELDALYAIAKQRLHPDQLELDLFEAQGTAPMFMEAYYSRLIWDVLEHVYGLSASTSWATMCSRISCSPESSSL